MIRAFVFAALFALTVGCTRSDYNAGVFHPWCCDNAKELKARLDEYTNVLMVCVYEDHWEDRGPNRYSLHHYGGTVVRVYRGVWRMSERIAFVQGLDYPVPAKPASCVGNLEFVFTSEHTDNEIGLDTGELWTCNAEYAPALDRIYRRRMSPRNRWRRRRWSGRREPLQFHRVAAVAASLVIPAAAHLVVGPLA